MLVISITQVMFVEAKHDKKYNLKTYSGGLKYELLFNSWQL